MHARLERALECSGKTGAVVDNAVLHPEAVRLVALVLERAARLPGLRRQPGKELVLADAAHLCAVTRRDASSSTEA